MSIRTVLLIGGSGFVGSAVAARLARDDLSLLIPTRHRERARHLLVLPTADVVQADVFDAATLDRLMSGVDAVVNLVGVLHSRSGTPYGADFAHAHVELPQLVVAAARKAGVARIVHVSALGADADGPSEYLRSKAAGEAAIRAAAPAVEWVILRPSVIFGPEDHFLNLFASLLERFPVLPLGGAAARFQPVYVEDVAEVVAAALQRPEVTGEVHELAGPRVYTLQELVRYAGKVTGHRRPVIGLPEGLAMLQAGLLECLPGPLMSRDNVRSMRRDNIARGPALPWGLQATPLEAIVPTYLGTANRRGRFTTYQLRHP